MFKSPDVTTAQIVAIIGALLGVAAAAGLNISAPLEHSIIVLVTVLSPILILADAHVRHGRATGTADRTNKTD